MPPESKGFKPTNGDKNLLSLDRNGNGSGVLAMNEKIMGCTGEPPVR